MATGRIAVRDESAMMPTFLGRLLCLLGFHDFQILEISSGFGAGGSVAKVKCRRCHFITARRN